MKHFFLELAENLPALLQNSHLSFSLEGWPAAVAVVAIALSSTTVHLVKVLSAEVPEMEPQKERLHIAA